MLYPKLCYNESCYKEVVVIYSARGCGGGGLFVCVEVLRPSQPNGVIRSALPNEMSSFVKYFLFLRIEKYFTKLFTL